MGEKEIKNALITHVSITMVDHGVLTFYLTLNGGGWVCNFGGYVIGNGYLGADVFKGSDVGLECLMRVMDTVGVERWEDLKGKYVRTVSTGWGDGIKEIGNIIDDKWFNVEEFFKNSQKGEDE